MINPLPQAQATNDTKSQNEKRVQAAQPPSGNLRKPPAVGGPRRLPDPTVAITPPRRKKMSKALKGFLLGGSITGAAGIGSSFLFF